MDSTNPTAQTGASPTVPTINLARLLSLDLTTTVANAAIRGQTDLTGENSRLSITRTVTHENNNGRIDTKN
jgi:hypothetical protein